jgi:predicted protein tyrosine phosphatase
MGWSLCGMSKLLISPFSAVGDVVRRYRPSHMLTLMVEPYVETPASIEAARHLRINVHDIVEPAEGAVAPCATHISDILAFARSWDRNAPFLVHCWAGISRSTAAAYILMCDMARAGEEEAIARDLRFHAPHAHPNRLMIRHADALLGREGRMIAAVEAMGEARSVWEGEIVELALDGDRS